MLNWKPLDIIYLYDGSFDGLLTIVFECFLHKQLPSAIFTQDTYQTNFIDKFVFIETDFEKSKRILDGILKNISYDTFHYCYYAFWASDIGKELLIVKYLCLGFLVGPKVNTMLAIDYVFKVQALRKKVFGESHRMKGLLRFIALSDSLFYANVHLDHNVVDIIGRHFVRRLPKQNFIIVDQNRNLAFVYNTHEYQIVSVSNIHLPAVSETEQLYQNLWKTFFKTIAIKERKNPRLQAAYMPRRYWQDLIENVE